MLGDLRQKGRQLECRSPQHEMPPLYSVQEQTTCDVRHSRITSTTKLSEDDVTYGEGTTPSTNACTHGPYLPGLRY